MLEYHPLKTDIIVQVNGLTHLEKFLWINTYLVIWEDFPQHMPKRCFVKLLKRVLADFSQALKRPCDSHRGLFSPAFCLETGVQAHQEGMIRGLLKNVLFCLDPVDVLEEKHTKTHPNVNQRSV